MFEKLDDKITKRYRRANIRLLLAQMFIDYLIIYFSLNANSTFDYIVLILFVGLFILSTLYMMKFNNNKPIKWLLLLPIAGYIIMCIYAIVGTVESNHIPVIISFYLRYILYINTAIHAIKNNPYNDEEKKFSMQSFLSTLIIISIILTLMVSIKKLLFNEIYYTYYLSINDIPSLIVRYFDLDNMDCVELLKYIYIIIIALIIIFDYLVPLIKKEKIKNNILHIVFIILIVLAKITAPPFEGQFLRLDHSETTRYIPTYEYEFIHTYRSFHLNEGIYEGHINEFYIYNPITKKITYLSVDGIYTEKVISYNKNKIVIKGTRKKVYTKINFIYGES